MSTIVTRAGKSSPLTHTEMDANLTNLNTDKLEVSVHNTYVADLASTANGKGSELVGFLQAGTSAVAQTVEEKLQESISVLDFGAVGDGSTDCLAAFTAAFAAAAGKKLRIPAGSYRIPFTASTACAIAAGTTLVGDGQFNTTVTFVPSSTSFRTLFDLTGDGVTFKDMKITCECPAGGSYALLAADVSNVKFERCDLDGAMTNVGAAISHNAWLAIFPATGTQTDYDFLDCNLHGWAFLVLKQNTHTSVQKRLAFAHCDIYENYYEDLSFNSPNGSMDDIQVYMCRFRDSKGASAGLNPIYCAFASVTNFRVASCSFEGDVGATGHAIHVEENCIGGTITGNTVYVDGYGIELNANHIVTGGAVTQPQAIVISGNTVRKAGTQQEAGFHGITAVYNAALEMPGKNSTIADNIIVGYAIGIYSVTTQEQGLSITDNYIDSCAVGIDMREGASVSGNTTANCTVGLMAQASTNTATDTLVANDHTFINCATNVDATEHSITLLNPTFIFPPFSHGGGGTDVFKPLFPIAALGRVHGFLEIAQESSTSQNSYARRRDEVLWDGTTFTPTNKFDISPGNVDIASASNSGNLAVQVFLGGSAQTLRVQAKLNGMAVIAV
jgi:hypothetical protein